MIDTLLISLALLAQNADTSAQDVNPAPEASETAGEDAAISEPVFDQATALEGVNAWLNGIETYQARFDQVAPDGSASGGTLYMRRPGRLRFEYDAPTPLLVVADGTTVAVEDSQLNTVDRVPLGATPLWWILKEDVNLAEDAQINDVWIEDNRLYISAQDRDDEMDGLALFVFNPESYALEEWFVRDSLGYTTRIILSDPQRDMALNPRLFVLEDAESDRRGRRR